MSETLARLPLRTAVLVYVMAAGAPVARRRLLEYMDLIHHAKRHTVNCHVRTLIDAGLLAPVGGRWGVRCARAA